MLTGSCLCGRVAYEADAEIEGVIHCHCETCRKAHGAAFSSLAAVPRDRFRWIRGDAARKSFESSPGKLRHFCSECGSGGPTPSVPPLDRSCVAPSASSGPPGLHLIPGPVRRGL